MVASLILAEKAGWHWWFAPFWILVWLAVVVVFWRLAPWRGRRRRGLDARAILAERFARGEIDASEYRARLEVLDQ